MNCKICGVKTAKDWSNGICFFCDWLLGLGLTEHDIKESIKNERVLQIQNLET